MFGIEVWGDAGRCAHRGASMSGLGKEVGGSLSLGDRRAREMRVYARVLKAQRSKTCDMTVVRCIRAEAAVDVMIDVTASITHLLIV